jgi:L-aspartate oxidase
MWNYEPLKMSETKMQPREKPLLGIVDFLVIGSGIAGLSLALEVADHGSVLLVTKSDCKDTNTNRAQGGIASVLSEHDSIEEHVQDTLEAGVGLCHDSAVRCVVSEGPSSIDWLIQQGTQFTRTEEGDLHLGREGGHRSHRIIHADDLTGAAIEHALLERARQHPNMQILSHWIVVDLITNHHVAKSKKKDGGPCYGAYLMPAYDPNQASTVHRQLAKVTVLATGGSGQVYQHTTNPTIATGDGIALAYRAGALLANLEFFQFHPTSLFHPNSRNQLITEALRGHGARLLSQSGAPIMEGLHPLEDLAPRDVVARGIDRHMKSTGEPCVYLDATHLDASELLARFPNIHKACMRLGIDMREQPIPVVPAAHYQCGGVRVDLDGRTSLPRLFAIGEVASTGVHGANRLASNSLLEAVVFSRSAAKAALQEVRSYEMPDLRIPEWDSSGTFDSGEWVIVAHDREELRRIMWDYVGIVRSAGFLRRAHSRVKLIASEVESFYRRTPPCPGLVELRNMLATSHLIIRCARFREESRGLHTRSDFPSRDEKWVKDTIVRRSFRDQPTAVDLPKS